MTRSDMPTASVIVITFKRPAHAQECIAHLLKQVTKAAQIIVVDGSPDRDTETLLAPLPEVIYVRHAAGAGNMTSSRNAGLPLATADYVVFLDDDANARPDFIEQLTGFWSENPSVQLGCARATNGTPDEATLNLDQLGVIDRLGQIWGNFGGDPGRPVTIDHGLGATMWMKRSMLQELGGFREYFAGTSAREDTDMFLRGARLGHQAWFVNEAVVEHVAAPQDVGERFDLRYMYWSGHNTAILYAADKGLLSGSFIKTLGYDVLHNLQYGGPWYRRTARTLVVAFAWLRGSLWALRKFGPKPKHPVGGYARPAAVASPSSELARTLRGKLTSRLERRG